MVVDNQLDVGSVQAAWYSDMIACSSVQIGYSIGHEVYQPDPADSLFVHDYLK